MRNKMWKGLLLIFCLISMVVTIGVIIGLKAAPKSRYTTDNASDSKPGPAVQATSTAAPEPALFLVRVAVVDFSHLLSAHPWTAAHKQLIDSKWAEIQSMTNKQARDSMSRIAEVEQIENRNLVLEDIRRIVAAYAATNNLTLVFDRSANVTTNRPIVMYSSNAVTFEGITSALGVKDITRQIMGALATERPKPLQETAAAPKR